MKAGERVVATQSGYIHGKVCRLIDRGESDGWHGFVLMAPGARKEMRRYTGAWNGERLATGRDMRDLRKRYPELFAWLKTMCPIVWPCSPSQ